MYPIRAPERAALRKSNQGELPDALSWILTWDDQVPAPVRRRWYTSSCVPPPPRSWVIMSSREWSAFVRNPQNALVEAPNVPSTATGEPHVTPPSVDSS